MGCFLIVHDDVYLSLGSHNRLYAPYAQIVLERSLNELIELNLIANGTRDSLDSLH